MTPRPVLIDMVEDCQADTVTDHPAPAFPPVRARSLPQVAWPSALPDWDDLTPAEQSDHRDICRWTCSWCADGRAFGECTRCGSDTEALGADELSRCCDARVILGPEDDDRRAA